MKNRMKKLTAMALGVAMLVGANATPVYAAEPTAYGSLDGVETSGYVVVNGDSATAGTAFSGYGGVSKVTAQVYYHAGQDAYYSQKSNSTTQQGGVSVTVKARLVLLEASGGKGIHKVTYRNQTWTAVTETGDVSDSAEEL